DKATQKQLDRGYAIVELLKQPQYQPYPVEDQIVSIYAGTKGYFDEVPVDQVQVIERELLQFIRDEKSEIYSALAGGNRWDDDLEGMLRTALDEFQNRIKARFNEPAVATA